tara:strand:+ start:203 stop:490 length:288 start_codon:yes stop_codon:yes gene_type:complete
MYLGSVEAYTAEAEKECRQPLLEAEHRNYKLQVASLQEVARTCQFEDQSARASSPRLAGFPDVEVAEKECRQLLLEVVAHDTHPVAALVVARFDL